MTDLRRRHKPPACPDSGLGVLILPKRFHFASTIAHNAQSPGKLPRLSDFITSTYTIGTAGFEPATP